MASSSFTVTFVTKAAISAAKALGFDIKQEQLEVVVKFAMGRDVFAVLPTYFGKTLCYQCLPGVFNQICFDGKAHCSIIVVISPLIAIIKDQVQCIQLVKYSASSLLSTKITDFYHFVILLCR